MGIVQHGWTANPWISVPCWNKTPSYECSVPITLLVVHVSVCKLVLTTLSLQLAELAVPDTLLAQVLYRTVIPVAMDPAGIVNDLRVNQSLPQSPVAVTVEVSNHSVL